MTFKMERMKPGAAVGDGSGVLLDPEASAPRTAVMKVSAFCCESKTIKSPSVLSLLLALDGVDAERASRHTKHWPALVPRAALSLSMMMEASLWIDDMLTDSLMRMPSSCASEAQVSLERRCDTHRCTDSRSDMQSAGAP